MNKNQFIERRLSRAELKNLKGGLADNGGGSCRTEACFTDLNGTKYYCSKVTPPSPLTVVCECGHMLGDSRC